MKLSTDYENLLKHVVDGFNRNFFRNEFKEQLKIIEKTQDLETINTAQTSIKTIQKGLIEYLANQLEEAKKQLIAIQSKATTEEN
tara:strand:- start:1414 stop:1668 length:255 start_codon:yes stop_codon:yes gene_type:complete